MLTRASIENRLIRPETDRFLECYARCGAGPQDGLLVPSASNPPTSRVSRIWASVERGESANDLPKDATESPKTLGFFHKVVLYV